MTLEKVSFCLCVYVCVCVRKGVCVCMSLLCAHLHGICLDLHVAVAP